MKKIYTQNQILLTRRCLVGGFNPVEKYSSNWIISPSRGENKTYLKPPPRCELFSTKALNMSEPTNTWYNLRSQLLNNMTFYPRFVQKMVGKMQKTTIFHPKWMNPMGRNVNKQEITN